METNTKKKNSAVKIIVQIVLVIAIFIALLFAVQQLGDPQDLKEKFLNMDTTYLLIVIGLTITYFVFMILPHFFIAIFHKTKLDKTRIFLNASNEYFFNGITPSQSGSQPFQSYIYLQHGVTADEASSILTSTYINYQFVANILSTVALVILALFHSNVLQGRLVIVIVGFALNFGVLLLIIFLTFEKKFPRIVQKLLSFFAKIKPLKKRFEKLAEETPKTVRKFQKSTQEMLKKKRFLIFTSLIRAIALIIYYSIPYFVAKALNMSITQNDFLFMMAITLVATTLMAWFPLPGSSGGVETVFVLLLTAVATINRADAVNIMFVTRLFTFYIALIWGLLALALLKLMDRIKNRKTKKYREQISSQSNLKVGVICDSFHDNPEAKRIYQELLDNGQNPYIITHTKNENNPQNTIYLKVSSLKHHRFLVTNSYLYLSHNRKMITKNKFDILHFVNATSHSRLLLNLKKYEPIPIFITENCLIHQISSFHKLKQDNVNYRLEKMLISSDRVLPKSLENCYQLELKSYKPSYVVDPTFITHNEFLSLKNTQVATNVDHKDAKHWYLFIFTNYEQERFIDFYFGTKDTLINHLDSKFIILGNLKLSKGIEKSIQKNHFEDLFCIKNDIEHFSSYLPNIDVFIQEEFSSRTSISYIVGLANNKKVLLPESMIIPNELKQSSNIYLYSYANNFDEQVTLASKNDFVIETSVDDYFNLSIGSRLTNLYFEVAKKR